MLRRDWLKRTAVAPILVALGLRKASAHVSGLNDCFTNVESVYGRAWVEDLEPLQREKNRILARPLHRTRLA